MQRFWSKVDKFGPDGCWLWIASTNDSGYGKFYLNGRLVKAHTLAWELTNGPIPGGMVACHKCDHPGCVNPAHIFIGTLSDNSKDCFSKKRNPMVGNTHWAITNPEKLPRGDRHPSKINPDKVL